MAKITIKSRYGTVPNDLLNNSQITFRAKGLYAFIQSKPDNWDFSAELISKQTKEGLTAVSTALKELESNGYLNRKRVKRQGKMFEVEYYLYDTPTFEKPKQGKPTLDFPTLGNMGNNSKQYSSNKEISNKDVVEPTINIYDLHIETDLFTCAKGYFIHPNFQQAIEILLMNHNVKEKTINELKHTALEFNKHCALEGKVKRSLTEWGKHFKNWLIDPKRIYAASTGIQSAKEIEKFNRTIFDQ